jgi:hypothetical protein
MKRTLVLFGLISMLPGTAAFSQSTVTVSYAGTVTRAIGAQSTHFPVNTPIAISYTLDPAAIDINPDPSLGGFPGAVVSMSVSFPALDIAVVAGAAGSASTADNLPDPSGLWSDQVRFVGGPISYASSIDGHPIDLVEVDFLTFLTPPAEPTTISSDALPLFRLSSGFRVVFVRTAAGFTQVDFQVPEFQTPEEQLEALIEFVDGMFASGELAFGQANGLTQILRNALRSLARSRLGPACSQLLEFEANVTNKVLDGVLTSEQAIALNSVSQGIRSDLGCQ